MINLKLKKNYFFLNILYISCSFDSQREEMYHSSGDLSSSQNLKNTTSKLISYSTSNSENYFTYDDFKKKLESNIAEIFEKLLSFIKNFKQIEWIFFLEEFEKFKSKKGIENFSKTLVLDFTGEYFKNLPSFLNKNCSSCKRKLYGSDFSSIYLKTIEKNSEFCCINCYNEEQKKASQTLDKTFYCEIPLVFLLEDFLIKKNEKKNENELEDFYLILDSLGYIKKYIFDYFVNLEKKISNYSKELNSLQEKEEKKVISIFINIGSIKTDKAIIEEKTKNLEIINENFKEIKKIIFGENFNKTSEIENSRVSEKNPMAESRVSIFSQSLVSEVCSRYRKEESEESECKKSIVSEKKKINFQNELEKLQNLFIDYFILKSSEYGSISETRSSQFISKHLIDKLNQLTLNQSLEFLKKKNNLNELIFSLEKINNEKIFELLTPAELNLIHTLYPNEKVGEELMEIIINRNFGIDHLKTILGQYFSHQNEKSRVGYLEGISENNKDRYKVESTTSKVSASRVKKK